MSDKLTDAEIKELQEKKQAIRNELYDLVKEEMFKASSELEGMTPAEALDEMVRFGEEHGLYDIPVQPKDNKEDETMHMLSEEGITPDSWVILEVNHEGEQFQKILSGWSGGYLDGDSWRLSSPIKEMNIDIDSDKIKVYTESGSWYNLYKDYQGLRMSNYGIYNQLKEQHGDKVEIIEL